MKAVAAVLILAACHREPAPAPPPPPIAAPATPAPDAPPGEPPPDPALHPVPPAIAAQVKLAKFATGFVRPVLLVAAPGDTVDRLFVLEQHAGKIRTVTHAGAIDPKPFLKITGLSTGNEEGLLGLAFHPQFATNGRYFVNYTSADMNTHVVEFKAGSDAPVREVAEIAQPYSNHNGGNLLFGPDGKLYTGMGDGGSANDPHGNGQNRKALLGKLLRFDVDKTPTGKVAAEIVDWGLRNPWRFWFDRGSHGLYIGDVGQNLWESVYVVADDGAPHNFGWNVVEGNHCFDSDTGNEAKPTCDRTGFTPPVADYPHAQGCSVTGGVVYRGAAIPALAGRYFYADYCTALVRSFVWTPRGIRDHWDWKAAIDPGNDLAEISSFGVDDKGEVYVLSLRGTIWKLAPATGT